jgi:HTH-type transcriptional regulator/antitoxin HigA
MTTAENLTDMTNYRDLLLAIEPRTINSEAQAESYRDAIDVLTSRPGMSDGQREMVGLLAQLVYDWEEETEEPITGTPAGVVQLLLDDRGLRQRDLVPDVFPTESSVSDFLAGRRPLSYDRVRNLATFFGVSPAVFFEGRPQAGGGGARSSLSSPGMPSR